MKTKAIIAGVVLVIGVTAYVQQLPKNVVNVLVDGAVVGNTSSEAIALKTVDELIATTIENAPYEVVSKSEVTYEPARVDNDEIMGKEALAEALEASLVFNVKGQQLTIDGAPYGTFASDKEAEEFLTAVKRQFLNESEEIVSSEFVETIAIEAVEVPQEEIVSFDDAWSRFEGGKDELMTYKIEPGDTTWDIASKFDMYVSDIAAANPEIDIDLLQIGQVINLNIPMSYINVRTKTHEVVEEDIINQTIYEKTDTLYVGESKLKTEGTNGKKMVELERTAINGVLEDQVVLSEEVIEEPVATVILSGSKWREVASTGEFIKPTSGTITSRFGMRWGRLHAGIDIGTAIGTPVKAADNGIVTKVGYISGYGKAVILDHGNGRTTLYGHLSGYAVQVGQSVPKGTVVAYSGATGNVTGPCLHFEVRENGTPIDPLKYIDLN
ncbi:MAG: M23 family metallopeptidase [Clostridia bacterium]|nr:M23 family metallopeptidase [Clostridia bacterium]